MDSKINPKKIEKPENINGIYASISQMARSTAEEIYSNITKTPLDKGKILMVVGPERSGKSVVAIDLHEMFETKGLKNRNWIFAQPAVDRPDIPKNKIFSRVGKEIVATSYGSKSDIEKLFHENEVVVIDEIHFTPADLQSYLLSEITLFVERGGILIGIGLHYTSQGGEFIFSALLKSRAEKVYKLSSLCQMCGRKAERYSQRLIDGVPASLDTPALLSPSANVTYEPRCDECFVVKK